MSYLKDQRTILDLARYANMYTLLVHGNIDQTLVKSLHGLLYFEIGGLDGRVIITEYNTGFHSIHM